ncbi:gas vesicle protein [Streptomyces tailanensis]|uniref:gas vesicle protein n=1 Tax=Streptomyces tailanensis TaxID=2569858 RepID=UPI00122E8DE0|nr:gas vesicle protein [Streptomyces tailanensis]
MSRPDAPVPTPSRAFTPYGGQGSSANLADILERVLDKGIVIVGDIKVNLLDIELLTIKLRLLVASVDKAKEIGIDWWEHDPALSSRASRADGRRSLEEQNERLRAEVRELRSRVADSPAELSAPESAEPRRSRDPDRKPRAAPREERRTESRPAEPRRKRRKVADAEDGSR